MNRAESVNLNRKHLHVNHGKKDSITNFKHAELMSITIVWIDTKPKHSKITQIT